MTPFQVRDGYGMFFNFKTNKTKIYKYMKTLLATISALLALSGFLMSYADLVPYDIVLYAASFVFLAILARKLDKEVEFKK